MLLFVYHVSELEAGRLDLAGARISYDGSEGIKMVNDVEDEKDVTIKSFDWSGILGETYFFLLEE